MLYNNTAVNKKIIGINMVMLILGIGLGILFVLLVIAGVILVKSVRKTNRNERMINQMSDNIISSNNSIYDHIQHESNRLDDLYENNHRFTEEEITKIKSMIDSNYDKLNNRIVKLEK